MKGEHVITTTVCRTVSIDWNCPIKRVTTVQLRLYASVKLLFNRIPSTIVWFEGISNVERDLLPNMSRLDIILIKGLRVGQ